MKKHFAIKHWLLIVLALLLLCLPIVANAHAVLLSTTPRDGAIVDKQPQQISLNFDEPLAPDLISLNLYDASQRQVPISKPLVRHGKPVEMYATLPKMTNGTYTAVWSVVSQDGHVVRGSYDFSIGNVSANFTPLGDKDPAATRLENLLIGLRYVVETLALLSGGLYWIAQIARKHRLPDVHDVSGLRLRRSIWAAMFLGSIGEWFTYSASLPGSGLTAALIQGNWGLIGQTPFAQMVLVQLLLLLLLLLPNMVSGWYLVVWALFVADFAFGGHAWSIQPVWLALTVRVMHLLTIAVWLGALSYLTLTFSWQHRTKQPIDRSEFRPFFVTTVAIASVLVLVTGVLMVIVQTDVTKLLNGQLWGKLLIIKIALMMVMMILALRQTMRWQRGEKFLSFNLLRIELLIGVLVIQAAIWMSQSAYPLPIKTYQQTLHAVAPAASQATVQVQIPQLRLGNQLMSIVLPGNQEPQKVNVLLQMLDMNMGTATLPTQKTSPGHYQVSIPFEMSGNWRFTVDAEYAQYQHVQWTDYVFIPREGE